MVKTELCEDLIDDIIVRLPPKSILQFRCVSKSWCSRIDSSNFIRKQAIHSDARARRTVNVKHLLDIQKGAYEMFQRSKPEGPILELDSLKFSSSYNSFIYYYGIICLYNITSITLWKPSIKRKLNVPNVPYDPYRQYSVVFGFGYDSIADDYNVVCLCTYGITLQTLYLYSTKTNAWSEIDLPEAYLPFQVRSAGNFVNGAMHWVVKNNSPNTNDSYILTFNLSKRVFGVIPLPSTTQGAIHLSVYTRYLAVILNDGEESSMWLRKLDNNNVASWSKRIKIICSDFKGRTRVSINDEWFEVHKAYNHFSEASRTSVSSSNSCVKYELDSYVETLVLLDNENCLTNKETNMFEKILSYFRRL
ncbi:putative F-box protein At3g16210 [Rutidosis leptorrhynchoides]|uniref:putative F-box protein At3g16210 n=1 Tax=Rutidosis leptorrhynchoides TaxID=125765 RepID=UPI003A99D1D4